jgi:glycosyltransferase involved in cell wall biosynthesis
VRVALSMLNFVPGGMGGSETYARELALQLEVRHGVDLAVVVPANAAQFSAAGSRVIIDKVRTGASTAARLRGIVAAWLRGRDIRARYAADVVHFPFTIPVPWPRSGQACVMTIHDVQHHDLPALFSRAERIFRYFVYDRPARKATLVITVSEFAKSGIVRYLHVSPDRVRVIPLGVDFTSFAPYLAERENFVLYPARGWKHKNHVALIEAMSHVREHRPGMKLVLTGGALESLGAVPDWVDVRGIVPSGELRELYRKAAVLAFPSLYEGFGLPPLEAMASGCPVAASDAGSLPEVCGEAAVMFDPNDPVDIARGIEEAIGRRDELVVAGLSHVREFTWERCAAEHEIAYREAVRMVSA